jgi:hypothetical protein
LVASPECCCGGSRSREAVHALPAPPIGWEAETVATLRREEHRHLVTFRREPPDQINPYWHAAINRDDRLGE